jgi:peroxiredoxin
MTHIQTFGNSILIRLRRERAKLILCTFLFFIIRSNAQSVTVTEGLPAPEFSLYSVDGVVTKSESLKGKVVLINFFATWCAPCLRELPSIQEKIWNKYKDNKTFVLIAIGRGHGMTEIKKFKEKTEYSFPMYPDSNKVIFNKFAEKFIPRNYILDRNGIVVYSSINYDIFEFDKMLTKIDELLKE